MKSTFGEILQIESKEDLQARRLKELEELAEVRRKLLPKIQAWSALTEEERAELVKKEQAEQAEARKLVAENAEQYAKIFDSFSPIKSLDFKPILKPLDPDSDAGNFSFLLGQPEIKGFLPGQPEIKEPKWQLTKSIGNFWRKLLGARKS